MAQNTLTINLQEPTIAPAEVKTVKRFSENYLLESLHPSGKVIIACDLVVQGSTTELDTDNTIISDNIITLNNGETDNGISIINDQKAGIEIDRGLGANATIYYNDNTNQWEATDNPGTINEVTYPLNASVNAGINVILDTTPELGGDLYVNDLVIRGGKEDVLNPGQFLPGDVAINGTQIVLSAVSDVKITPVISLDNQLINPAAEINVNKVYAKAVKAGGTGLYVTNSDVEDELVSKTKAIVFSLIF